MDEDDLVTEILDIQDKIVQYEYFLKSLNKEETWLNWKTLAVANMMQQPTLNQ